LPSSDRINRSRVVPSSQAAPFSADRAIRWIDAS
jgi:hypothetical protein